MLFFLVLTLHNSILHQKKSSNMIQRSCSSVQLINLSTFPLLANQSCYVLDSSPNQTWFPSTLSLCQTLSPMDTSVLDLSSLNIVFGQVSVLMIFFLGSAWFFRSTKTYTLLRTLVSVSWLMTVSMVLAGVVVTSQSASHVLTAYTRSAFLVLCLCPCLFWVILYVSQVPFLRDQPLVTGWERQEDDVDLMRDEDDMELTSTHSQAAAIPYHEAQVFSRPVSSPLQSQAPRSHRQLHKKTDRSIALLIVRQTVMFVLLYQTLSTPSLLAITLPAVLLQLVGEATMWTGEVLIRTKRFGHSQYEHDYMMIVPALMGLKSIGLIFIWCYLLNTVELGQAFFESRPVLICFALFFILDALVTTARAHAMTRLVSERHILLQQSS